MAAYFRYEQTVLQALKESESALVAFREDSRTAEQLCLAVDSYSKVVSLTTQQFTTGLVGLTDLLDTERQLNTSEQNLLSSHAGILIDLVILFKTLGGGWENCL